MRLAELLAGIAPVPAGALAEIVIGGISVDSRSVRPGDLFVAVPGLRADGHEYLADAARAGAVAALVERELPSPPLPVVMRVAGSGDGRACSRRSTTSAPAVRASSASSSRDSSGV